MYSESIPAVEYRTLDRRSFWPVPTSSWTKIVHSRYCCYMSIICPSCIIPNRKSPSSYRRSAIEIFRLCLAKPTTSEYYSYISPDPSSPLTATPNAINGTWRGTDRVTRVTQLGPTGKIRGRRSTSRHQSLHPARECLHIKVIIHPPLLLLCVSWQ